MYEESSKRATANQILNVIWGVMTAIFLLLVLYFIWKNEQIETRQKLNYDAQRIADNTDQLIENISQSINKMNIHGHDFNDCNKVILPSLQRLVYSDQTIAGVIITDQQKKIICSTLPEKNHVELPKSNGALEIFGPVQVTEDGKPSYILQQQLGQYYIEIYILKHQFEEILTTKSFYSNLVGIFDKKNNKMLVQMERADDKSPWLSSNTSEYLTKTQVYQDINKSLVTNSLVGMKNIDVILKADNKKLHQIAWRYALMAGAIIVLLSLSIYYYLRSLIHQHFSLHRAIVNGLKHNDFFPVYQPLIDRRRNICCGAEVLLRWNAGNQETIMPDSFIEYAEESGLIVPITKKLAEIVFKDCSSLLHSHPDFHLSINLSAVHFADSYFFDSFIDLCREHNIQMHQIMFEVTERDLLQEDINLIRKMKELRQIGFSIAVDDFGTGHASISYLQHFPFNYLKIDRLFIQAIGTGAVTETLNQAIINMAKGLELKVIAEGVETYQQLEALEENGVYLIQGWYFAKAMSFEKLHQFLQRNSR